jgi:Uma2 family endonuclease
MSMRSAPAESEEVPSPPGRLSLEQYEAIVESGVLSDREQFHLINGYLVAKQTRDDRHCTADELCGAAPSRVMPDGWHVRAAKPVRLPVQVSKPEPDRSVVRGAIRDYSHRSPEPADIALVVEVSDSSLGEDREMARIYGGSGIAVYWIVNLVDRQVEVYTLPYPDGYHSRQDFAPGQLLPVVIDGVERGRIGVADVMP